MVAGVDLEGALIGLGDPILVGRFRQLKDSGDTGLYFRFRR